MEVGDFAVTVSNLSDDEAIEDKHGDHTEQGWGGQGNVHEPERLSQVHKEAVGDQLVETQEWRGWEGHQHRQCPDEEDQLNRGLWCYAAAHVVHDADSLESKGWYGCAVGQGGQNEPKVDVSLSFTQWLWSPVPHGGADCNVGHMQGDGHHTGQQAHNTHVAHQEVGDAVQLCHADYGDHNHGVPREPQRCQQAEGNSSAQVDLAESWVEHWAVTGVIWHGAGGDLLTGMRKFTFVPALACRWTSAGIACYLATLALEVSLATMCMVQSNVSCWTAVQVLKNSRIKYTNISTFVLGGGREGGVLAY